MVNYGFDYDEGIILESDEAIWESRDEFELTKLTLTNKNLYCAYEKSNGFFKKSTEDIAIYSLADIKIIAGKALIQQTKYEGVWCLQIHFKQGVEYFSFYSSPKKVIPQWLTEIKKIIEGTEQESIESAAKQKRKDNAFGNFAGIASNRKNVAESATQIVTDTIKQSSENSKTTNNSDFVNRFGESAIRPVVQQQKAKFCSNCGTALNVGAKFCHECGTPTDVRKMTTPPPIIERDTQIKHTEQRQQEYVGTVLKCPNCGSVISRATAICPDCGMKISTTQDRATLRDFREKMIALESKDKSNSILGVYKEIFGIFVGSKNPTVALIRNYPIPDTVDEIVEFIIYAKTCFDSCNLRNDKYWAWYQKIKQLYMKAKMSFPNDIAFKEIERVYLEVKKEVGE